MRNKTMRNKTGAFTFSLLCSALFATGAFAADSIGEPGREAGKPNPLKNLYFGEQHMHTQNSFDAFTIGVTQTWEQAYRFGRGEEVTLNSNGEDTGCQAAHKSAYRPERGQGCRHNIDSFDGQQQSD